METDLFLELDYPFLDIIASEDVFINFGALQVFLTYLLSNNYFAILQISKSLVT